MPPKSLPSIKKRSARLCKGIRLRAGSTTRRSDCEEDTCHDVHWKLSYLLEAAQAEDRDQDKAKEVVSGVKAASRDSLKSGLDLVEHMTATAGLTVWSGELAASRGA